MLNQNGIFSQYIDMQNPDNLANVHKEYLDSDLVRLGVFLDLGCDKAELVTNQVGIFNLFFLINLLNMSIAGTLPQTLLTINCFCKFKYSCVIYVFL